MNKNSLTNKRYKNGNVQKIRELQNLVLQLSEETNIFP